ncbi:MAG: hypothetical protein WCB51_00740 [Candidatus Dormiibacterota bacterium]
MAPPAPICTTTTAEIVCPAVGLTFDVPEKLPPAGHAETYDDADGLTIVRFMTIAVAPAGMPFAPMTVQTSVS